MKQLTIGILAHVDSGKTTLSEAMLYCAGNLRRLGRVDHKDAFLDTGAIERARGITIFSKMAVLNRENAAFYLLDTPGHVDFSAEMERTLGVLDYAVLVVSGTDGVQSHTETLWRLLARYHVPAFVFVNKMDLPGANCEALLQQLRERLHAGCMGFTGTAQNDPAWHEELALCDEAMMQSVLETGSAQPEVIAAAVAARKVFPCYFGAALKLDGVEALLAGMDAYTQEKAWHSGFGARVFKIARDEQGNRLTYLKITGGSLHPRDALQGVEQAAHTAGAADPATTARQTWTEKASAIRVYSGAKFTPVDEALPGMICAVTGLTRTRPGDGIGVEQAADAQMPVLEPVLTYRVELPSGVEVHTALSHLRTLEEEDPQLRLVWNETLGELHVQLMGEVQLEVLQQTIAERFGIDVRFGQGSILYKETIADVVEGVGHFEPLRHYAEVHLLLEPGARGSGMQFVADCSEDMLDKSWQKLILTHLAEKQHIGVLTGAPVTDLRITLVAGRAHLKHTEGGDFREATYRAVRQGLMQAQSILLEPWYSFRLAVPTEATGRAMTDLQRKNTVLASPQPGAETTLLTGSAPVAALWEYAAEVAGYTRGKGRFSCAPGGYAPCANAAQVIAAAAYDSTADLANTPDSVFCTHGAGYHVRWDEVKRHMQVPAVLQPPKAEPLHVRGEGQSPVRAAAYCASLEQDKELLAIFERTYGSVQRDLRTALHTQPSGAGAKRAQNANGDCSEAPERLPEYVLVDGYNIIFAWEDLSALAKENLDSARRRLTDMLCNYAGYRKCSVILVFDAYRVKGSPGAVEQAHNIHVVYTKEAETADMYIEKVTHALAKKRRVRVASSDGMEQMIILGHGALRMSAAMFREEIDRAQAEIRAFLQSGE